MEERWLEKLIARALKDYFGEESSVPLTHQEEMELRETIRNEWKHGGSKEALYALVQDAVYEWIIGQG